MFKVDIQIPRADGTSTVATIRELDQVRDGVSWFVQWFPKMLDLNGYPLYEDSHWDVIKIWHDVSLLPEYKVLVLEADGALQGYAVVQVEQNTGIDGRPCGYIAFIATAPWNRRQPPSKPDFKGIGKLLIGASSLITAQHISNMELELYSLPAAEAFYLKLNFQWTGRVDPQGLKHFRLDHQAVLRLLAPIMQAIRKNGGPK